MSDEKFIHKHAFWLYGVLVGLAIKQALETSIPHLIAPARLAAEFARTGQALNFPHTELFYPEILRLTVFLALTIRFYFGSVYFFGTAYEAENADTKYSQKNYGSDFIFGFLHFISFVILALTIDLHSSPVHWFVYVVAFILLYDAVWYGFTYKQATSKLIFWWMLVNVGNALFSAVLYFIIDRSTHNPIWAEIWALWPVLIVSVFDIGWMMNKRPFFAPIARTAPRHDTDS